MIITCTDKTRYSDKIKTHRSYFCLNMKVELLFSKNKHVHSPVNYFTKKARGTTRNPVTH